MPQWLVYVNVGIGLIAKLGGLTFLLALLYKGLDWVDGRVQYGLEEGKKKVNELKFLDQTQVDDMLFDTLKDLSFSTFKTLKGTLQKMLEDGEITQDEFREKLHADVKANFKTAVSKGKKELLAAAFDDIDAVIDVMLPGVIRTAKNETKAENAAAKVMSATPVAGGN